jgi:Squalene-hopene cyclase C-terminal domain
MAATFPIRPAKRGSDQDLGDYSLVPLANAADLLPLCDLRSTGPLPRIDKRPPQAKAVPRANQAAGEFWLDGDVILCACPDCRAPMSVRFWLMVADCWRCGTSIELTEAQEREIERLLAERQRQTAVPPPPSPRPRRNLVQVGESGGDARQTSGDSLLPAAEIGSPPQGRHPSRYSRGKRWLRDLLIALPAWLISMLLHVLAFALFALIRAAGLNQESPFITLSTVVSQEVNGGGDTVYYRPDALAKFDLPLPSKANLSDTRTRAALLSAAQDARELRLDEPPQSLPDLGVVKSRVGRADGFTSAFAARDPRLRAEVVTREGGTTLTEAAVSRGLRWLANHQNEDGSWSLAGFHRAGGCNCSGDGAYGTKSPGTALALLPFLGAGQTHLAGKYKGTVSRGLKWLLDKQGKDGDLRAGANGNEGMYTQGQATIVLCEAFAMTGDEALRVPAQKAVDFVVAAQYRDGGWRYLPGPKSLKGDTSVLGWQLMALQSARSANLKVPEEAWELADMYLETVQRQSGALYAYQPSREPSAAMTAEALLCRMYLGWTKDQPGLRRGVTWLGENELPTAGEPNIYYWYYATQVMHHVGGEPWEDWNLRMRDVLVKSQETRGHAAGSWTPRGEFSDAGGRIYMTSLAVCTLEVYYRHLPVFRKLELGK